MRARGVAGGHRLPARGRSRAFAPDDRRYAGTIDGARATLRDFNAECSPAHLRVRVAPGKPLDLVLHTADGMRQETRAHGLDDTPREYNGALKVRAAVLARMPADDPRRAWIDSHLGGERIAVAPVAVTSDPHALPAPVLGAHPRRTPARPDVPRDPPDGGMTVGRATEAEQDGWTPSC